MAQWLKHYAPITVLRAADVLADHVDFWEEESFRSPDTKLWRNRELTNFIRSNATADRDQSPRFRQLLVEYIEMSSRHPPPKEHRARRKALGVAVVEIRRWLRG